MLSILSIGLTSFMEFSLSTTLNLHQCPSALPFFSTSALVAATVLYKHSFNNYCAFAQLLTIIIMLFPTLSVSVLGFAAISCAGQYAQVDRYKRD